MEYKTIIVDTIDTLFPKCMNYVCEDKKMEHPSDKDGGKGWTFLRKEWEIYIQKLAMSGHALVVIAHETEKKLTDSNKQERNVKQPDLPKSGLDIILELSDMILRIGCAKDRTPILQGLPDNDTVVGCRGGIVIDNVKPTFENIEKAIVKARGEGFMEIRPFVVIYGPPKSGKSELASEFPNAFVIDTENGYKFLKDKVDHIEVCRSWERFKTLCNTIEAKTNKALKEEQEETETKENGKAEKAGV